MNKFQPKARRVNAQSKNASIACLITTVRCFRTILSRLAFSGGPRLQPAEHYCSVEARRLLKPGQ